MILMAVITIFRFNGRKLIFLGNFALLFHISLKHTFPGYGQAFLWLFFTFLLELQSKYRNITFGKNYQTKVSGGVRHGNYTIIKTATQITISYFHAV